MARSGCIYGSSGSFKTQQIAYFARYIAQKTGKRTLLLSLDGGGWAPCQPEIDAGMIEAYRCEASVLPLSILRKIAKGNWPEDINETDPASINLLPIDWSDVGGLAVEGWTSIGTCMSRYVADNGISVGGEDRGKAGSNMLFTVPIHVGGQVQSEAFGSTTRGDYKFVQNQLNGLVMQFNSLPCEYVLYTALESKTEDDDRSTIYGPAIEGKKGTAQCPSWVGDLIHAQDFQFPRTIKVPNPSGSGDPIDQIVMDVVVRMFYRKHPDPSTGILFPAKPRITDAKVDALEQRFPGGYFEPKKDGTDSFGEYLLECDRLSAGQADSLKDWRQRTDKLLGRTR